MLPQEEIKWPSDAGPGVRLTYTSPNLASAMTGPSAGPVYLLSLLRALTQGVRLREAVASTGVVTPSGHICGVGGIKAKATGAKVRARVIGPVTA